MHADLMLADFVMVHVGKLFVTGGGISVMAGMPSNGGYDTRFGIGLAITLSQQDADQEHHLKISVVDHDGRNVPIVKPPDGVAVPPDEVGMIVCSFKFERPESMAPDEDIIAPLAFQLDRLQLPRSGMYKLVVEINGNEAAFARFRVRPTALAGGLALADS